MINELRATLVGASVSKLLQTFAKYIQCCAELWLRALERAYDTHLERVQMRLAPLKSRSWRDVQRPGGSSNSY
jgi:hypothetical protein